MVENQVISDANEYARRVKMQFSYVTCYLYGSHAYGTPTEDSDIDIAVICDKFPKDSFSVKRTLWNITRVVNTSIEPIFLSMSQDKSGFAKMITEKGLLLNV